jgi:hypothetical protein
MPTGIYDRTKSRPNTGIFRKGEHRSLVTEFKKGQRPSPDTEFKLGIGNGLVNGHGKYDYPEYLNKQSLSHKGQHSSPTTEIKRGQRLSPQTEFKELVPGGVSTEEMLLRASPEYIQWRKAVYKRDNFTCKRCGAYGVKLEAHHIKRFATHPELRFEVSNGITLCKSCHRGGDAHAS